MISLKVVWGTLKAALAFLGPLLRSKVGAFLADPRTKALALQAVEAATHLDLDGDGKHDHAVSEMIAELKALGIEYAKGWVAMAVEAAYQTISQ